MIYITDKQDCVGCNACTQRCPTSCISMQEDEEGFLYPYVNQSKCIHCGLCEKVCPVIHQASPGEPINTFAAKNMDDSIRRKSSSGGVFHALACNVLNEGGVVFGARFNSKWGVEHSYTETISGLAFFQGSKYVQSNIGTAYTDAERFLKAGRKVLFSGTPCQLAGLRLFLRKDYGNLLLSVDVACHGVPSPAVWQAYLAGLLDKIGKHGSLAMESITKIDFRDIRHGWNDYGFSISGKSKPGQADNVLFYERRVNNLFMRGFLADLYLRPSCHECPAKCGKSKSDITLADYWGIDRIHPSFYDKLGVSLVLANSANGLEALSQCSLTMEKSSYNQAVTANPALVRNARRPEQADIFMRSFQEKGIQCLPTILSRMKPSLLIRIIRKARRMFARNR